MKRNENIKKFTLMHKNIPTALIGIDMDTGGIAKIYEVLNKEHFPICCLRDTEFFNNDNIKFPDPSACSNMLQGLKDWWTFSRTVPQNRQSADRVFPPLQVSSGVELLLKSNGLSLTDQYFVLAEGENKKWEKINYFKNKKESEFAPFFVYDGISAPNSSPNGPELALSGVLPKAWGLTSNGDYELVKAGRPETNYQEPYSEKVGSLAASNLGMKKGIEYVGYTVTKRNEMAYSRCPIFTNEDTEIVTASNIMAVLKRQKGENIYQHYLRCCEFLGADKEQAHTGFARIEGIDSVLGNPDRHHNNFGYLRNSNTLKMERPIPSFDLGESLWNSAIEKGTGLFEQLPVSMGYRLNNVINSQTISSFSNTHAKQIAMLGTVRGLDVREVLDFSKLKDFPEQARTVLLESSLGRPEKLKRLDIITNGIRERIKETQEDFEAINL